MLRRTMLAAAGVLVAGAALAQAPVQAPVQLGAIEILTGPNAAYGTAIRAGLELALK